MKLTKAIEILSDSANRGMTTFNQDYNHAQKLGIEALDHIKALRRAHPGLQNSLLPSETEEQERGYSMEIPKAIEILQDLLEEGPQFPPDDRREAVQLGIEALEQSQVRRNLFPHLPHLKLPSETKE